MSRAVTDRTQIIPGGAGDCSEMVAGARLSLHRVLVAIHDTNVFEDELPTLKTRREWCFGAHCPGTVQNEALDLMHSSISLL